MWNKPTEQELSKLPAFYSTEHTPLKDKVIQMHFFLGGCDWYGIEFDPVEKNFFGFVILNGDYDNAEWGYFSLEELASIKVSFLEVDKDLHWSPKKAIEVRDIRKAHGWVEKEVMAL